MCLAFGKCICVPFDGVKIPKNYGLEKGFLMKQSEAPCF